MANALDNHARDLVIRARAGDQLAVAMIGEVTKSAKRGSKQAQLSTEAIARYIDRNPAVKLGWGGRSDSLNIGAESASALTALNGITRTAKAREGVPGCEAHESTCLLLITLPMIGGERVMRAGSAILSNGPALTPTRLNGITGSLRDPAYQEYFAIGVNDLRGTLDLDAMDRTIQPFVSAGQCLGRARAVQLVRCPTSPLSVLDEMVAWELGQERDGSPLRRAPLRNGLRSLRS